MYYFKCVLTVFIYFPIINDMALKCLSIYQQYVDVNISNMKETKENG